MLPQQISRRAALLAAALALPTTSLAQSQSIYLGPPLPPHVGEVPVHPMASGSCGGGCVVVDFEGIGNQAPIGTISGVIDITFGANWFGLIDSDAGGTGNIANEPSPDTVAFVNGGAPLPINFSAGVNFIEIFYVAGATSIPMTLTAWDGPDGTGNIVDTAIGDVVGNQGGCSGDPSGIFCLWDVVTLTSTGNNIRSITLAGALSDQFAFDSMTFCTSGDADGDGLLDEWETCGIDIGLDGTIDLDLPAMGADPNVPDVFVEIDGMVGRTPAASTYAPIVAAFAAQGINLHLMVDEATEANAAWPADWADFDGFKAAHLGTAAERALPNAANIAQARAQAFHYCAFAEQDSAAGSPGRAEVGGNDFYVTLGNAAWGNAGGTIDQRLGMFMHLLGHNLGLRDGGADDIAFKPNYQSVMNPTWTLPRNHNLGRWALDFSSGGLNSLDEAALDEAAGLGGALDQIAFAGPPPFKVIVTADAVDWDEDGTRGGTVAADVNDLGVGTPAAGESYTDHDDWSALVFNFRDSADFADGVHQNVAPDEPVDAAANQTLSGFVRPSTYCVPSTTSVGTQATLTMVGQPTLGGADDLEIVAAGVPGRTFGLLIVSLGEDRAPFFDGTLCVAQPFVRVALVGSGGTLGGADGELRAPITDAFMNGQGWGAGEVIYTQWAFRDQGLPTGGATSEGMVFVVQP